MARRNSRSAPNHCYVEYLSLVGQHERAIQESERAREFDPLSNIMNAWAGSLYFFARRYDMAIEQYRNAAEMDPNFVPVHLTLGQVYVQKGMFREAIAESERAVSLSGGSPVYVASLAHACGVAGRTRDALRWIDELKKLSARRYVSSFYMAIAFLGLGDKQRTLASLEKAVEERSPRVLFLTIDPRFDRLRSDSRFQQLLERAGPAK